MLLEQTCTSKLQTFHRPRKLQSGSPVKAAHLDLGKRTTSLVYDPRPTHLRKLQNYNSDVRSLVVNNCFKPKIAMNQMYGPANPYALDADHSYLPGRQSDWFLRANEVTVISADRFSAIERDTQLQSHSPLWSQERMKRLTASNFGRIAKATERLDIAGLVSNLLRPRNLDNIAAVKHGRKHESVALAAYTMNTQNTVNKCGLFVFQELPFLAATPDGVVEPGLLVEVKCPYTHRDKAITHATVPYLIEQDGILQLNPNHDYHYQIQGQLMITGKRECDLVVYTKVDLKVVRIHEDKEFQHRMRAKLQSFFDAHFKPALLELHFFKRYDSLFS